MSVWPQWQGHLQPYLNDLKTFFNRILVKHDIKSFELAFELEHLRTLYNTKKINKKIKSKCF